MYLFFDNGGTKTRVAYSHDGESFNDPIIFPTEQRLDLQLKKLKTVATELSNGNLLRAVVGGIAGPLNKDKTCLMNSPHLSSWVGLPIKNELENIFGCQVFLENDSALVGLGEAVRGAGRGDRIVAYITISTGVGGVRIVDKKIDNNSFGFEPGYQIINFDITDGANSRTNGHLEEYVSGRAIEKEYGKKPNEIKDKDIWTKKAEFLAVGLNNIIVLWSPDIIVLGGSMMKEVGISVLQVEKYLQKIMKIFPSIPKIKKAELGDIGGLYGALAYAKDKLD